MAISCKQCGAALTERDAFCTKCGARRSDAGESVAASRFCTKCGTPLVGETKFCTKCGAPAGAPASSAVPAATSGAVSAEKAAVATPSIATREVGFQAAASSGKPAAGIPKGAIIGGAIVVLLVLVVAIAGFIHAAHRAREKAQEMEAAQNFSKSLADLASSGKSAAQSGNTLSAADINKALSGLAAANALKQNGNHTSPTGIANSLKQLAGAANIAPQPAKLMTQEEKNKSLADAAVVANAIWQHAGKPGAIPPNELPSGTGAVTVKSNGTFMQYQWQSGRASYRWYNSGLAVDYPGGGMNSYGYCPNTPPVVPHKTDSIVPGAATGNQAHDWALEYERTVGGPDADLVVRTGDINNLGFGWPQNFDPFSGQSTPIHPWPDVNRIPPQAPDGTDRIMVGSAVTKQDLSSHSGDGYSGAVGNCSCPPNFPPCPGRLLTMPQAIRLEVGALPSKITAVVFQIFADDFQAPVYHSHFQVSLNGTRIPSFEYAINSLDQSGPIGKLVTLRLLPEYWPLLKSGTVKMLIDDPTTHVPDGYAVDFVRILVNPHKFKYQVSLSAHVTDADTHKPITGATVTAGLDTAATDKAGKCELNGIPAGLVVATASAPGYDENSVPVDLPAGQAGSADIQLHRHQETTAALEQSIAQTGSATIYGIHFDTNSPNFRPDSLPALNAVLGLIHNHPGSKWLISGHTDNQGNAAHNQTLSVARAKSVVAWLKQHGVDVSRLVPQGFGATRPVADNATANGRFLNRRVEVALAK